MRAASQRGVFGGGMIRDGEVGGGWGCFSGSPLLASPDLPLFEERGQPMADVRWHFREMSPAEINQNPMERELFAEESLNERLVREAVQNSLDAGIARLDRATSEPVRVRFSLRGVNHPLGRHRRLRIRGRPR